MRRKRRSKKRMAPAKKKKLMTEVAIVLIGIIAIFVIITTVSVTQKIVISDTETLWKYADNVEIRIEWRNGTDPTTGSLVAQHYKLSDIGTYYDGWIYISLTPPEGYEYLRIMAIYWIMDKNNKTLICNDLIEYGVNMVEVELEAINSSDVVYYSSPVDLKISLKAEHDYAGFVWWSDPDIIMFNYIDGANSTQKYEAINKKYNASIDIGTFAITVVNQGICSSRLGLYLQIGDVKGLEGIKLRFKLYVVSTQKIYKFITQPLATLCSTLVGVIVSFYEKIKSVALGALGGFSVGAFFTALIDNIYVAILLSVIFVIVFIYAISAKLKKKKKTR